MPDLTREHILRLFHPEVAGANVGDVLTYDTRATGAQWKSPGTGGTGSGVPGGSVGQVQINAGGSNFAGVTMSGDVLWDTSTGVATIQPGAVGYGDIQPVGPSTLLGNPTGIAANVSEITLGAGMAFVGSTLTSPNQLITFTGGDATGSGTSTIALTVTRMQGRPVSAATPNPNDVLQFISGAWTPTPLAAGAGGANTQVQYNNAGVLAGSSAITINSASNTVTAFHWGLGGDAFGDMHYIGVSNNYLPLAIGSLGQILTVVGAGIPGWANSAGITGSLTNHQLLVATGTSTVVAVPPGTSGYILTSNGSGADPTWQPNAGGGIGEALSDGNYYARRNAAWAALGTMANQNATSVAITGGSATNLNTFSCANTAQVTGTVTSPNILNPKLLLTNSTSGNRFSVYNPGSSIVLSATDGTGTPTTTMLTLTTTNSTFAGKVITVASATGAAGLNLPHGVAPTAPADGDAWTTTTGMFARINGATVGPFGTGGGGSGIVASSTVNQVPYYSAATTVTGNPSITSSTTGALTINASTGTVTPPAVNTGPVQVVGANGLGPLLEMYSFGAGTPNFAGFAAAGTVAAPAVTPSGQVLISVTGFGYTGSAYTGQRGSVQVMTSESWTTNRGTSVVINTTPTGTTGPISLCATFNTGLTIGTATPQASPATGDLNASRIFDDGVQIFPGFAESVGWLAGASPNNSIIWINNSGRTVTVVSVVGVRSVNNTASAPMDVWSANTGVALASGTKVTTVGTFDANGTTNAPTSNLTSGSVTVPNGYRLGVVVNSGTLDTSVATITVYLQ